MILSCLFGDFVTLAVFDTFLEFSLVSHLKLFLSKRFGLVYLENFAEKNQKFLKKLEERKSKFLNDFLVGLECFSILFSNPWWAKTL